MKSFLQRTQGTSTPGCAGSFTIPMDLSGTFDTVFTIFVVHEEPEPSQLFREIALLLKPGCTLFYTELPSLSPEESSGTTLLWPKRDFLNR